MVYSADDWKLPAPLAAQPGVRAICAAVVKGTHCGDPVVPNTPLCERHGGKYLLGRTSALLRREAMRMQLLDDLIDGAKTAVRTYMEVMETGEKDADRIRAADRVLELLGFRGESQASPLPQVDETILPGGQATEKKDDFIDAHLTELLQQVSIERVTEIIRVTTAAPQNTGQTDERDIIDIDPAPDSD